MAEDSPGFLGRWSRRKVDALQGKPLQEPLASPKAEPPAVEPAAPAVARPDALASGAASASNQEVPAPEKTLSLDDVRQLTGESDFKPFVARSVAPEVRNAAMKKLFADPHYNVMDGLDIYIDDYSQPDPIPPSMLRQMTGARLLKIFDDEKDTLAPEVNPNNPTAQAMAQSAEAAAPTCTDGVAKPATFSQPDPLQDEPASQHNHADPHLRLQPDHAPPAADTGRGAS